MKHPRLLFLLVAAALAAFLALGTWQVRRLAWKEALLLRLEVGIASAPRPFISLAPVERADVEVWEAQFERVTATGQFDYSVERPVYTMRDGRPGYRMFTLLQLTDGGAVFVDRGFVAGPPNDVSRLVVERPSGLTTVTGLTRRADPASRFDVAPDRKRGIWYTNRIADMTDCTHGGVDCSRYIEADRSSDGPGRPQGRDPRDLLASIPNSHLGYAITWYGLALALAAVYGFFLYGNSRKSKEGEQ